jgi:hypothetical protein
VLNLSPQLKLSATANFRECKPPSWPNVLTEDICRSRPNCKQSANHLPAVIRCTAVGARDLPVCLTQFQIKTRRSANSPFAECLEAVKLLLGQVNNFVFWHPTSEDEAWQACSLLQQIRRNRDVFLTMQRYAPALRSNANFISSRSVSVLAGMSLRVRRRR